MGSQAENLAVLITTSLRTSVVGLPACNALPPSLLIKRRRAAPPRHAVFAASTLGLRQRNLIFPLSVAPRVPDLRAWHVLGLNSRISLPPLPNSFRTYFAKTLFAGYASRATLRRPRYRTIPAGASLRNGTLTATGVAAQTAAVCAVSFSQQTVVIFFISLWFHSVKHAC